MLKGTNVSSGIGIGNAVIVEEKELVFCHNFPLL